MRKYGVILLIIVVTVLVMSTSADAQCSMCRAVLNSSNNGHFIRNFNIGVLVLLLPPVSIFCSIFIVLRRYRGEIDSHAPEADFNQNQREQNAD